MANSSHHHVVTKGLQKHFASDGRVTMVDKVPRPGQPRSREVSPSDSFVRTHFSSVKVDGRFVANVEDVWMEHEDRSLPPVRSWIAGEEVPSERDRLGSRNAAKVLAALHFARSNSMREMHTALADERRASGSRELLADPTIRSLWIREYGTEPTPEAMSAVIDERAEEAIGTNSVFAIEQMLHYFKVALGLLEDHHVQAARTSGPAEMVLGDGGLVVARDGVAQRGRDLTLAVDWMHLPLAPGLAAVFSRRHLPDVRELTVQQVQDLNRLSWDSAGMAVIMRPGADQALALAGTTFASKLPRNARCPCGSGAKVKNCHHG